MTVDVKICGLKDQVSLQAATHAGAKFVGFVFYPPSPRAVTVEEAKVLSSFVPSTVTSVGLFVDPTDALLLQAVAEAKLGMIQLHGKETAERIDEVKKRTGLPVMKAVKVGGDVNLQELSMLAQASDWLLFDAFPQESVGALPGGNAKTFDWKLLRGLHIPKPWMLAGGLNVGNLDEAVKITGAKVVDVSSGVEDAPGRKNPTKIAELIAFAKQL